VRTTADVLRSLQVYMASVLGPEWEVREAIDEGTFKRPFCRVTPSTAASSRTRGTQYVDLRQSFAAVCFPVAAADELAARYDAAAVEEKLLVAFAQGVHAASFRANRGHPMRIPLYDTAGIALDEVVPETARGARDFMRVIEEPQVQSFPDPHEDRAFTVTLTLRIEWSRYVGVVDPSPIATSPGVTPNYTP
jgi:hypothetical protein